MFGNDVLERLLLEVEMLLSAAIDGFPEVNKAAANPFSAFAGR
ncbi:hypothetical protein [Hyphomonas pacifica]|uniref:Uncharacterized protein n=1 Tax=Hyphomonas pacifica TaxID=1280941 RepID=A0A062U0B5_9PROT|nr:hypothetical protein [Hyphomonas pacifica]KCZ51153.1 hypothetical protein HY2_12515 [Hyphomonas pacifica]RAN33612.1 hypothetical protein HY3_12615 [Hyphomonas pacifica]RAN37028.1 hypothetical protein HY11_10495 [Hyphomonas pacifica]